MQALSLSIWMETDAASSDEKPGGNMQGHKVGRQEAGRGGESVVPFSTC